MTQPQEQQREREKDVWDLYFEENPIQSVFRIPEDFFVRGTDEKLLASRLDAYETQWKCCCKIVYCEIDRTYYMVKE